MYTTAIRKLKRFKTHNTILSLLALGMVVLQSIGVQRDGWSADRIGVMAWAAALFTYCCYRSGRLSRNVTLTDQSATLASRWQLLNLSSTAEQVHAVLGPPAASRITPDGIQTDVWYYPDIGPDVQGRFQFENGRPIAFESPRLPSEISLLRV